MKIGGENSCYICGNTIKWEACVRESGQTVGDATLGQQAQIVATGKVKGTNGPIIQFEVTVRCPRCHNANKYLISR